MRKTYFIICLFFLTVTMPSNYRAADFADLKFIGFSTDGKYLAFEESSGYNSHHDNDYATTYFVDVAKNTYIIKPEIFDWVEDSMKKSLRVPLYEHYKKSVAAKLKRLKIEPGNIGKLIVAHLPGDRSFQKPLDVMTEFYDSNGQATEKMMPFYVGSYLSEDYDDTKIIFSLNQYSDKNYEEQFNELKLVQSPSGKSCSLDGTYQINQPKIELTLKSDINHRDLKPQILQKDEQIPISRACGDSYQIEQVFYYEGNIAVFLHFYRRGIEGYDRRYMVVTGEIKFNFLMNGD